MARLRIHGIAEHDLRSFPDVAGVPGYYLNVVTGDIFRNGGHFTEANLRIVEQRGDTEPLQRRPFVLLTTDLSRSLLEVKELAAQRFGVPLDELGKLVHNLE